MKKQERKSTDIYNNEEIKPAITVTSQYAGISATFNHQLIMVHFTEEIASGMRVVGEFVKVL